MNSVSFLEKLISIPSPSGKEDAVAGYLGEEMTALGFRTRRDDAGNVIGFLGNPESQRTIVLLGHMDTVPGLIPVRQTGIRLYGRGAVDAKGPLAAFVLAAAQAQSSLEDAQVMVIGAVEEEAHGRGARHLARTLPPPTCAIIGEPSDWQGITIGYKGLLKLDYRLVQPGGHSAGSIPGPAEEGVSFWNKLMMHAQEYNSGQFGLFSTIDPALRGFCTFSDGLDEGVEMNIAVRLPPGLLASDLEKQIRTWCNGASLKFYPSDPPFQASKNNPLIRAMLRAIRTKAGRPRFKLKTGTSDMNIVGPVWDCPIIAYGPGDSSLDHTPDEHVKIPEFLRAIDILAKAIQTLAR